MKLKWASQEKNKCDRLLARVIQAVITESRDIHNEKKVALKKISRRIFVTNSTVVSGHA